MSVMVTKENGELCSIYISGKNAKDLIDYIAHVKSRLDEQEYIFPENMLAKIKAIYMGCSKDKCKLLII